MKKFIHKVTVTGADDSTNIDELFDIQKEYPFVEFGILLSDRYSLKEGTSRFPSKKWLYTLIDKTSLVWKSTINRVPLKLSGHICGKWATQYLKGKYPSFEEIHPEFDWYFERWQINTHGEYHTIDFEQLNSIVGDRLNCFPPQRVIFQLDGVNEILPYFINNNSLNVDGLFDMSSGAGVLPSKWMDAPDRKGSTLRIGYSGGLSPDNVVEQIENISKVSNDHIIWIDAETHLRSPDNRVFDLNNVRKFLKRTSPYIVKVP